MNEEKMGERDAHGAALFLCGTIRGGLALLIGRVIEQFLQDSPVLSWCRVE
jgi:hypothetical protein